MDLVVADYNYVFDPNARLSEALSGSRHISLLVDEAHNLPERARTMFSADLYLNSLKHLQDNTSDPELQKQLKKLSRQYRAVLRQAEDEAQLPPTFVHQLQTTVERLNDWFAQQSWLLFPDELFEHMMALWRFAQRAQAMAEEDALLRSLKPDRIQIFCTDPAPRLQQITADFHSSHFFSGSLLPMAFFQRSISTELNSEPNTGSQAAPLALDNPFPAEHLCTLVAPVNTRFQQRADSIPRITEFITTLWDQRPGRYLMALPSYDYLTEVSRALAQHPQLPLCIQPQSTDPAARADFLQQLQGSRYLAGVIAGGLFAEGIDLEGNTLDGVIVIGTCLPPPTPEREHIKQHFDAHNGQGFDFAYRYPAVNRVIQTAGRLIRSEQDRGLLLLMDDRYTQPGYRTLLPVHWQPQLVKNQQELRQVLDSLFHN